LQTSPFWTSILAYFLISETVANYEIFAMVLCFCGVIGIAMNKPDASVTSADTRMSGIILAFAIAWLYSGCNVLNRRLKHVHFLVIQFYHASFGLIFAIILLTLEHVIY
jgi:drug/metabolite transporter (DMT)-like permease